MRTTLVCIYKYIYIYYGNVQKSLKEFLECSAPALRAYIQWTVASYTRIIIIRGQYQDNLNNVES